LKEKIIFNWSGGKDSALCLYKVLQVKQYDVLCLMTTISQQFQRISMHGVRLEVLKAQVTRIGLPLQIVEIPEKAGIENYEKTLSAAQALLKRKGATAAVFGDIFLEDLKEYRERFLAKENLKGVFPLWKMPTKELLNEFLALGFKTIITCVNEKFLDKSFAGRVIDRNFIDSLPENVDPCGENGEFHTFVFDGPIFKKPVPIKKGKIVLRTYKSPKQDHHSSADSPCNNSTESKPTTDRFWFCDLLLQD